MHGMHSGDLTELGGANLTDAEREALLEVMQRAKVLTYLSLHLVACNWRLSLARSSTRRRRDP